MIAVQELRYASAAPTAADENFHEWGEILLNSAPEKGGILGWICTAEGRPGTWAPFGVVNDFSADTVAAGGTLSAHVRYLFVQDAGALVLAATSNFPAKTPITIRCNVSSLTITPTGADADGAAALTLTAGQHVTLMHLGTTNWYSVAS